MDHNHEKYHVLRGKINRLHKCTSASTCLHAQARTHTYMRAHTHTHIESWNRICWKATEHKVNMLYFIYAKLFQWKTSVCVVHLFGYDRPLNKMWTAFLEMYNLAQFQLHQLFSAWCIFTLPCQVFACHRQIRVFIFMTAVIRLSLGFEV
jgi:hypothetical protein